MIHDDADLRRANAKLAEAAADVQRARTSAALASRPGLAYAAVGDAASCYLVSQDGRVIGELFHDSAAGAISDWYAQLLGSNRRLGPFRTARQAAVALTTLTRQEVRDVVDLYVKAWVEQDADLIVTIFTEAATYHERAFDSPIRTRAGIREYWQRKVIESQAEITCDVLNLYVDGTTAIVEWEVEFDDLAERVRKRMREVAILVFEGRLIASLREYWSSERVGTLADV